MKQFLFSTVFLCFLACSPQNASFQEIGYFGNDTVQYYTFNIPGNYDLSQGMTPEMKASIREHGTALKSDEVVTGIFYFKDNAPDIANAIGGLDATTKIKDAKPVAVVWASPNGQIQVIENPR